MLLSTVPALVLYRFCTGTVLVRVLHRSGTELVQQWLRVGAVKVLQWHRTGAEFSIAHELYRICERAEKQLATYKQCADHSTCSAGNRPAKAMHPISLEGCPGLPATSGGPGGTAAAEPNIGAEASFAAHLGGDAVRLPIRALATPARQAGRGRSH